MKVIHIISSLDVGGAENMLCRLVTFDENVNICKHMVICLKSNVGVVGQRLEYSGIEVVSLNLESMWDFPSAFFKLCRILLAQRPDAVQTWMYHADLIGGISARLMGCRRVIWNIRNTDIYFGRGISKKTKFIVSVCAFLSKLVPTKIVSVAKSAADCHIRYGYDARKFIIIGNGFDVANIRPFKSTRDQFRKELGIQTDAVIIGSMARFNEYKDHYNFIQAASLCAHVNPEVYFLMAGKNVDFYNDILSDWVHSSGFKDRFRLIGSCEDVTKFYSTIDMFCLHSLSEGFPNVLGEAMSASVPCIATDVGDVNLILGDAGLIVPPQNAQALSDGMQRMLELTYVQRAAIGLSGKHRIRNNWSLKKIWEAYMQIYRRGSLHE